MFWCLSQHQGLIPEKLNSVQNPLFYLLKDEFIVDHAPSLEPVRQEVTALVPFEHMKK